MTREDRRERIHLIIGEHHSKVRVTERNDWKRNAGLDRKKESRCTREGEMVARAKTSRARADECERSATSVSVNSHRLLLRNAESRAQTTVAVRTRMKGSCDSATVRRLYPATSIAKRLSGCAVAHSHHRYTNNATPSVLPPIAPHTRAVFSLYYLSRLPTVDHTFRCKK